MSKELYGAPKYDVPSAPRDNKAIIEDNQAYIQPEYSSYYGNNPEFNKNMKQSDDSYNMIIQKQAEELMEEQENPFDRWNEAEKTPEYLELCANYTHSALDKYNEFKDSPDSTKESYIMKQYVTACHDKINDYLDEKYPGWWHNDEDSAELSKNDDYNPDVQYETNDDCKDFVNKFRQQEYEDYNAIRQFDDVENEKIKSLQDTSQYEQSQLEPKQLTADIYSKPDLNGYYDDFYKNAPESYANDLASDMASASIGDAGNMLPNGIVAEAGAPTSQKVGTVDLQPARNEDIQFENEKQNQSIAQMQGEQVLEQASSSTSMYEKYGAALEAKFEADNKDYQATQQAYADAGLDGPKMPGSKYYG